MKLAGGCHCGSVRFTCDGEISWAGHCHCRDCQLTSGAPLVTWITMPRAAIEITGTRRIYRSSSHGLRSFCPHCGALLFFESDEPGRLPTSIDIAVACLDEPDRIKPEVNIFVPSRPKFMKGFDAELPSYDRNSPGQE
jgi:hypothetical protein